MTLYRTIHHIAFELSCKLEGVAHLLEAYAPDTHSSLSDHKSKFMGIGSVIDSLHHECARLAELIEISEHVDLQLPIPNDYRLKRDAVGVALAVVEAARKSK